MKYAPKITTWIQVIFAIVASIVQIVQIAVNPQAQLFGTVSVLALAVLALVIIYFDYKSSETTIRMREIVARKNGAIDALGETEGSFKEDAKVSADPNEKSAYLRAAGLVRRHRELLEKLFKEVREQA